MGIVTFEATGPDAEQLANQAGERIDVAVGFDPEFGGATFDSDTLDDGELEAVLVDVLAAIDPDWQEHLRLAE